MKKRNAKTAFFAAACVLCLWAAGSACSLSGGNTTWRAEFSWSPFTSITPSFMKAADRESVAARALGRGIWLSVSFGEGITVACSTENRWAAVDAAGFLLVPPPPPPVLPFALERLGDGFAALTGAGTFRYSFGGGSWRVETVSRENGTKNEQNAP